MVVGALAALPLSERRGRTDGGALPFTSSSLSSVVLTAPSRIAFVAMSNDDTAMVSVGVAARSFSHTSTTLAASRSYSWSLSAPFPCRRPSLVKANSSGRPTL